MNKIHKINRKMERFLGYSFSNEVRPDTKGALYSDVQESEKRIPQYDLEEGNNLEAIGAFLLDKKSKLTKYFKYKSRGNIKTKID